MMDDKHSSVSIVMYPWFAMGHLIPFLRMSNKLANRGHKIFFLLPTKTQAHLKQYNLHPDLINFIHLSVPQVEGLPPGAETSADIPFHLLPNLHLAMDRTQPQIESILQEIKPQVVFFDYTHWLPKLARSLAIKSIFFMIVSSATVAYTFRRGQMTDADQMKAPPGYPSSCIKLLTHEAREVNYLTSKDFGGGLSFLELLLIGAEDCDAIGFQTCREMEGPYCEFIEREFKKPVILAGPVVPEQPTTTLEEKWEKWLSGFKAKSVIFCAFGSECRLQKDQFEELLKGLELSDLPFFAALKPPIGSETIEMTLPEGFKERVQERGVVYGGWVQQQLILAHSSVGCFVTHCGSGSLSEGLVSECQMVLLPQFGDQFINARLMGRDLRVGVEVEKGDEDGLFTKEGVCKAIRMVMDDGSEIGKEVRANHAKWKDFLLREGIESSYIDEFINKMKGLFH